MRKCNGSISVIDAARLRLPVGSLFSIRFKIMRYHYFALLITLTVGISACSSKVNETTAQPAQSVQPAAAPGVTPAAPVAVSTPVVQPGAIASPAPAEKAGKTAPVPEIMKGPLRGKDLEKALEQLPPQVREQLKGMQLKRVQPTPPAKQ